MILQKDVAVVLFAEAGPDVVLAIGDELAELRGEALVLDDLDTVDPVLAVGSVDDDACGVPLADGVDGLVLRRGDHVVEEAMVRSPAMPFLASGWSNVVEDLVLEADGGAGASVEVGIDEVLDAAVGSGGDAEVDEQFEVGVLARGDDVAGVAALFTAVLGDGDHAVLDLPTGGGEGGTVVAAPAVGGLAVEEEMPALGFFCGRECVGCGLRDGGEGGG